MPPIEPHIFSTHLQNNVAVNSQLAALPHIHGPISRQGLPDVNDGPYQLRPRRGDDGGSEDDERALDKSQRVTVLGEEVAGGLNGFSLY